LPTRRQRLMNLGEQTACVYRESKSERIDDEVRPR
jgi:hypothetical protein